MVVGLFTFKALLMITHTMTMEEVQSEVFSIYKTIHARTVPLGKAFLKKVKGQLNGKLICWVHHDEIIVKGNTILIYYSSRRGTIKDFSSTYFIKTMNSKGQIEYYQILNGGLVRKFSKHFLERFVERTNCKGDVLANLVKELSPLSVGKPFYDDTQFFNTLNGLAVFRNNVMVTYLNNLSQYKSEIREEALATLKKIPLPTRRESNYITESGSIILYGPADIKT